MNFEKAYKFYINNLRKGENQNQNALTQNYHKGGEVGVAATPRCLFALQRQFRRWGFMIPERSNKVTTGALIHKLYATCQ